jgi:exodeoxyribonuclease V alpha subunit
MAFLQGHGVSTSRAVRIYKEYGADAIPLVSANPCCLARDIAGICFKSADFIADGWESLRAP